MSHCCAVQLEEMEADLKQKAQHISTLQAQKADAVKAEAAASAKVKQVNWVPYGLRLRRVEDNQHGSCFTAISGQGCTH